MKTYRVYATEITHYVQDVEANSKKEALEEAIDCGAWNINPKRSVEYDFETLDDLTKEI